MTQCILLKVPCFPFLPPQPGFCYLHPREPTCHWVHQVPADHRGYSPKLSCPLSSNIFSLFDRGQDGREHCYILYYKDIFVLHIVEGISPYVLLLSLAVHAANGLFVLSYLLPPAQQGCYQQKLKFQEPEGRLKGLIRKEVQASQVSATWLRTSPEGQN